VSTTRNYTNCGTYGRDYSTLKVRPARSCPGRVRLAIRREDGGEGPDVVLDVEQARDLAQQLLAIAAPEGAGPIVSVGLRSETETRVVQEAKPPIVLRDPHRADCQLRYNRATRQIEYQYDWCGGSWYGDARSFTDFPGIRGDGKGDIGHPTPERRAIWDALIANGGTDEVVEMVPVDNAPEGVSGASFLKNGGVK
jgi:hypothetical protein